MRPFVFIRTVAIVGTLGICVLLVGFLIYSSHLKRVEQERWSHTQGSAYRSGAQENALSVPVLCYHYVREDPRARDIPAILGAIMLNLPFVDEINPWTLTESSFEKQIRLLSERGYTSVGLDDLAAWKVGKKRLPAKSVVITFDDGDRSVLDIAYPILEEYGMEATLFVVTSQVGRMWEGVDGLTWEELGFLESTGVFRVESHTHNLHYKIKTRKGYLSAALAMGIGLYTPPGITLWQDALLQDLVESRRQIARHLGHDSDHVAWPFGMSNTTLDSLASVAGFRTRLTLDEATNAPSEIRRIVYRSSLSRRVLGGWGDTWIASLSTASTPARAVSVLVDGHAEGHGFQLNRYTVTSRTSIRSFAGFLAGKGQPHKSRRLFFGFWPN